MCKAEQVLENPRDLRRHGAHECLLKGAEVVERPSLPECVCDCLVVVCLRVCLFACLCGLALRITLSPSFFLLQQIIPGRTAQSLHERMRRYIWPRVQRVWKQNKPNQTKPNQNKQHPEEGMGCCFDSTCPALMLVTLSSRMLYAFLFSSASFTLSRSSPVSFLSFFLCSGMGSGRTACWI